jgi:hypothetical protein
MVQSTLLDIAKNLSPVRGAFSKPHDLYDIYEQYFRDLRGQPIKMLEVGVFQGESTKVFSRYFEAGTIIGVDSEVHDIDFSDYPNVVYRQAAQTSASDLAAVLDGDASDGLDIILDDASHVGYFSKITFDHLYSRLRPSGLYIIEDWGTGYWDSWPDGSRYQRHPTLSISNEIPKRIISHDAGMVGFLKALVDLVGAAEIFSNGPGDYDGRSPAEFLHIYSRTAVLKKAAGAGDPIVPFTI